MFTRKSRINPVEEIRVADKTGICGALKSSSATMPKVGMSNAVLLIEKLRLNL
jgi:hypothetical protein